MVSSLVCLRERVVFKRGSFSSSGQTGNIIRTNQVAARYPIGLLRANIGMLGLLRANIGMLGPA
jgi:hypothetical protein